MTWPLLTLFSLLAAVLERRRRRTAEAKAERLQRRILQLACLKGQRVEVEEG